MDGDKFEALMRSREYFHGLRLLPGAWPIIRVDGRAFTAYTKKAGYTKPFDSKFRDHMVVAAEALLLMGGIYAYTESDEISVLFPRNTDLFGRSVEKLVSVTAGVASSVFTSRCGELACFDSRVWLGTDVETVVDYFRWRMADSARNCLNGYAYWTLRHNGFTASRASKMLMRAKPGDKHDLLHQYGVNFNFLPLWQRRGIGLYWENYTKTGVNKLTGETVTAERRRVKVDKELPMGDEYSAFVQEVCGG